MRCPACRRPKLIDTFAGEAGAGVGYQRAGFCVDAVDKVPDRKTERGQRARLGNYPTDCPGAKKFCTDAVEFIAEHGHEYAAGHGSPTCTGYSRGTVAIADRLSRYDRLIGATREAFEIAGIPYVIENVQYARAELNDPLMLCWSEFFKPGSVTDTDGTPLRMERHRLFETNWEISGTWQQGITVKRRIWTVRRAGNCNHNPRIQVAGSYGGARRNKDEARFVRKGGYVPASLDVQRALLGTPWMSEKGCQLSIPPAYTEFVGRRLLTEVLRREEVAA